MSERAPNNPSHGLFSEATRQTAYVEGTRWFVIVDDARVYIFPFVDPSERRRLHRDDIELGERSLALAPGATYPPRNQVTLTERLSQTPIGSAGRRVARPLVPTDGSVSGSIRHLRCLEIRTPRSPRESRVIARKILSENFCGTTPKLQVFSRSP